MKSWKWKRESIGKTKAILPEIHSYSARVDKQFTTAIVKDYQMPAREQELADYISVWGRRQIILRGGNRGVVATALWGLDESFLGLAR